MPAVPGRRVCGFGRIVGGLRKDRAVAGLGETVRNSVGKAKRRGIVFDQKTVVGRLERVVVHDDRRQNRGRVGVLKAGRLVVWFDAT